MKKYFVIDTNVLLHNPLAIHSFDEHNVILPIFVIEELDKFKGFSDKNGMHARLVLREIDQLITKGALKKGASLKSKGNLTIDLGDEEEVPKLFTMDLTKMDNKILLVAYKYLKKKKNVIFVSKDVNARIKAEALGIDSQDYKHQKVEYSRLYNGWKMLPLSKDKLHDLYQKKTISQTIDDINTNEYIQAHLSSNNKQSVLARYNKIKKELIPIKPAGDAMGIRPVNLEQHFAFDLLMNPNINIITLVGGAGTGKTLITLACALQQTIQKNPLYEKILVARPIIPLGKDIGYLPGSKDKKLNYWMQPIFDNLEFILQRNVKGKDRIAGKQKKQDKIQQLMESETLEIEAITYIRGRSIPNQFIIIDEAQNLTPHEIKTIISRAGEGTKIVLTGDPEQIDNPYLDANSNGLTYTAERLKTLDLSGHMLLSKSERSELAAKAVKLL